MASRRRSERVNVTSVASVASSEAVGRAFRQVAECLERRVQEAVREQDERAERRLQEALREQDERAERRLEEALRLQEERAERRLQETGARLEQQLQQKEASIRALQRRLTRETLRTALVYRGEGALTLLEERVDQVEASLQRAMQKFFPKVESLLRQLEHTPLPRSASVPSSSSASASLSTFVSAASARQANDLCAEAPARALEDPPTGRQGAEEDEEEEEEEGDEDERQRKRVQRRVREAKKRRERSRAAPCLLGEALCQAAHLGRLEDVRSLLDRGANVNYTNRSGDTPLLRAAWGNPDAAMMSLLLERGADANAVYINGSSALHLVSRNDRSGQCIELLLGTGTDVNARCIGGSSPLHCAAEMNNEAAVRMLLAAGARKWLRGWDGFWRDKTPLEVARSPVVQELLSAGL